MLLLAENQTNRKLAFMKLCTYKISHEPYGVKHNPPHNYIALVLHNCNTALISKTFFFCRKSESILLCEASEFVDILAFFPDKNTVAKDHEIMVAKYQAKYQGISRSGCLCMVTTKIMIVVLQYLWNYVV